MDSWSSLANHLWITSGLALRLSLSHLVCAHSSGKCQNWHHNSWHAPPFLRHFGYIFVAWGWAKDSWVWSRSSVCLNHDFDDIEVQELRDSQIIESEMQQLPETNDTVWRSLRVFLYQLWCEVGGGFLSGDTCCSGEDCCGPTATINKDEAAVMSQLAHGTTTAFAVPKMISHIYPKNDCGNLKLL